MTRRLLWTLLFAGLASFYVVAATTHAHRINNFKARGDQSGYLWDAENVYANWHGRQPPILIGERNRMPLYAGYLALFYSPDISDDRFFEIGKKWNIYLSVVLLAMLGAVFRRFLPPQPAANLLLIVAFGYFVFKAGYVQSELLFYFLFFAAFVFLFKVLAARSGDRSRSVLGQAVAAGVFAALAHLTKAAMLPLVGIFLLVSGVFAWRSAYRAIAGLVMAAAFLAVLFPYLQENKRAFGQYFYNVNTTFYMWYDDWPQASVGTIKHGDGVGWPTMPANELPGAAKYLREHTLGQIAARVSHGFADMVDRSWKTFWYFNYVVAYLLFAALLITKRWDDFIALLRQFPAAFVFLTLYAVTYLVGIAFYEPVSGTGTTRFLIAHLLPLLFVLSLFFTREPFRRTEWRVGRINLSTAHFHWLVSAMLAFDLAFVIWPRLMTTYGGF